MYKRYAIASLTLLLMILFATRTVSGLYETTEPWTMYKHDASRSGYTASSAPDTNATVWSWVHSGAQTPIVADGRAIVADSSGLYAIDETTGVKLWGPIYFTGNYYDSPAIVGDEIYIGTTGGYMYCVNATNGAKIWEYQATASGYVYTRPVVANGKVYFGTTDNYLYALNAATGAYVWRYTTAGPIYYSSPAVDGTWIYFGCDDDKVYALNDTGSLPSLKWSFTTAGNVRSTPCVAAGMVFFGSSSTDHALFAVDKTSGQLIWKYQLTTGYAIDEAPAYFDGIVYFSAPYQKVYALYANATANNYTETDPAIRLWSQTVGTYPTSPVIADGKMFFGAGYSLYALNITNGMVIWTYTSTYTVGDPIVADGRVFVSDYYDLLCFGDFFPPVTYYYTVTPVQGYTYVIKLVVNATPSSQLGISSLTTLKKMNYTIEGIPGTTGMSTITIPDEMLGGPYIVTVDGGTPSYEAPPDDNGTHTVLSFNYTHSTHMIEITGTTAIPEFPSATVLMTLMTVAVAAAALARKKSRI